MVVEWHSGGRALVNVQDAQGKVLVDYDSPGGPRIKTQWVDGVRLFCLHDEIE